MFNNEDVNENLGRLKHTTKDVCEECEKAKLQLRVRTVDTIEIEYLYCPRCRFEKQDKRAKLVDKYKQQAKVIHEFEDKVAKIQEEKYKNRRNSNKRR